MSLKANEKGGLGCGVWVGSATLAEHSLGVFGKTIRARTRPSAEPRPRCIVQQPYEFADAIYTLGHARALFSHRAKISNSTIFIDASVVLNQFAL
jgi:hypothetical protein